MAPLKCCHKSGLNSFQNWIWTCRLPGPPLVSGNDLPSGLLFYLPSMQIALKHRGRLGFVSVVFFLHENELTQVQLLEKVYTRQIRHNISLIFR